MNGIEEREVAEIAKFTPVELKEYEDSLKTYRDLKNSLDTAEEKGRVEEKIAIARNLKSMGMSISDVSKATGLQEEEIKALWIYCNSIGFIGTGTTDTRQITNQRTCPYDFCPYDPCFCLVPLSVNYL